MATNIQQAPESTGMPERTGSSTHGTVNYQDAPRPADQRTGQGSHRTAGFEQTAGQQDRDDFRASGSPAPLPGIPKA